MSLYQLLNRRGNEEVLGVSAAWSLIGTLVYAGCQWGVLVTTVRLLTPADVGSLSLGFAISAPIFLFLQLRLRSASATDVKSQFTPSDYLTLRVMTTLAALLLTFVICKVFRVTPANTAIVLWVALAKAVESGSDLLYGFSQRANDMRIIAISMIGRGLLSFTAFFVLLIYTRSLVWGLAGLSLAWGAVLISVDVPYTIAALKQSTSDSLSFHWKMRPTATLIAATLPLGISTMLMSLSSNMPRYFIEKYLGPVDLGIFAATGYLAMAASVIVTALAEAGIARLARHLEQGDLSAAKQLLNKTIVLTLLLNVAGVAGSALFGERILRGLYSTAYASALTLLVWMMVISGIANLASVYGFALIAGRRYRFYLQSLVGLTVLMAAACAVLIPRWGVNGAVFACIAGYAVQLGWSYIKTRSMFANPSVTMSPAYLLNER